ncbi:hypothetical protein [Streptomyces sp. NPDC093097]|uniref:hypothetical protein n=1 Tax=Streptomyces sp. NPDC093097 TaxID=3366027 RepID=UPI00380F57A2
MLAPRMMRRIALFQIDNGLDFQEARHWELAQFLYRWHLERLYGADWKRAAPSAEVALATRTSFHPRNVPEGPARDIVRSVLSMGGYEMPPPYRPDRQD